MQATATLRRAWTAQPGSFRPSCASPSLAWSRTAARQPRMCLPRTQAKGDDSDDTMKGILSTANGLVDKASDLVPESVPRPAAKLGVGIAGGVVLFWLLQKVLSGVVTLLVIGGVGYYFLTQGGDGGSGSSSSKSSSKASGKEDLDDPLSEAKRIMDKYK